MTTQGSFTPPYCVIGPNGQPRFAAPLLGQELLAEFPAAKDGGGHLYVYADDRWQTNGEDFYRARVRQQMGNSWKAVHGNETLTWISATETRLDSKPALNLVRVANGIISIGERATLLDHSVEPLTPVTLPVVFNPKAKCPEYTRFVKQVMDADTRLIAQELLGYLLVPNNSAQKAFLLKGEGGNGKSVFMNTVTALLGADNVSAQELGAIVDNRFAVADLYGKLANVCADISSRELSSSQMFRAITGGDAIMAERKYERAFKFTPFARLVFSVNKYPPFANPTNALWDRWIVLPFDKRFRGETTEDKDLTAKLTTPEELSGILNYALIGLLRYREQGGFSTSPASTTGLDEFKLTADNVRAFVADDMRAGQFYERKKAYVDYVTWSSQAGHTAMPRNRFYERMADVRGEPITVKGLRGWRGSK